MEHLGRIKSLAQIMSITEAKETIRNDDAGRFGWGMAALVIAEAVDGGEHVPSICEDILICLSRGEFAASIAVCVLYNQTGRPWPTELFTGSRDPEEWRRYLETHGTGNPFNS